MQNVIFEEAVCFGEKRGFYFLVTREFMESYGLFYPEAKHGELYIECSADEQPDDISVAMSPTKEIDGCMTDYDWRNIEMDRSVTEAILRLAA